jgi:hypothetical protein
LAVLGGLTEDKESVADARQYIVGARVVGICPVYGLGERSSALQVAVVDERLGVWVASAKVR